MTRTWTLSWLVLSSFLPIQWFHMPLHMPGAKNQIEAQLVKGLREDHFAIADKANMPIIIDALEAVPKKDSNELRMIMDCSRPLMMNSNSCMDLEHYKYGMLLLMMQQISVNLVVG